MGKGLIPHNYSSAFCYSTPTFLRCLFFFIFALICRRPSTFWKWLMKFIRAKVSTAFLFIYGLLKIKPSLWRAKGGKSISERRRKELFVSFLLRSISETSFTSFSIQETRQPIKSFSHVELKIMITHRKENWEEEKRCFTISYSFLSLAQRSAH